VAVVVRALQAATAAGDWPRARGRGLTSVTSIAVAAQGGVSGPVTGRYAPGLSKLLRFAWGSTVVVACAEPLVIQMPFRQEGRGGVDPGCR